MPTHIVYKTCICGERFGSEGELARHQRTCQVYRHAVANEKIVEPLRAELRRLDIEANGIYVALAQAFGEQSRGSAAEAKYKVELAAQAYQHVLIALSELVHAVAEAAKNRDAIVGRLQADLKELVWRFNDLNSIQQAIRPALAMRSGS